MTTFTSRSPPPSMSPKHPARTIASESCGPVQAERMVSCHTPALGGDGSALKHRVVHLPNRNIRCIQPARAPLAQEEKRPNVSPMPRTENDHCLTLQSSEHSILLRNSVAIPMVHVSKLGQAEIAKPGEKHASAKKAPQCCSPSPPPVPPHLRASLAQGRKAPRGCEEKVTKKSEAIAQENSPAKVLHHARTMPNLSGSAPFSPSPQVGKPSEEAEAGHHSWKGSSDHSPTSEQLRAYNEVDQAEVACELQRMENCLAEERQRRAVLQQTFANELVAQKDAHMRDVEALEEMVATVLAENKRLFSMLEARGEAEKGDNGWVRSWPSSPATTSASPASGGSPKHHSTSSFSSSDGISSASAEKHKGDIFQRVLSRGQNRKQDMGSPHASSPETDHPVDSNLFRPNPAQDRHFVRPAIPPLTFKSVQID